jgi:uracil-DNA glycosylase family protein
MALPERPGAAQWVPERLDERRLADGIEACRGCELYADATQGVPGEGPLDARVMLVGEQPGDREDQEGRPFVGPAGQLLVRALEEAGLGLEDVYRTNAVKHFRWERRGSNRLHKTPGQAHVTACGPWLMAEVDLVQPQGVVLLGATAGKSLFGSSFRVGEARGRRQEWPESVPGPSPEWTPTWVLATTHPSAVLRSRNRDEDFAAFVEDLRAAAELMDE